jgi:hypothetical protein
MVAWTVAMPTRAGWNEKNQPCGEKNAIRTSQRGCHGEVSDL